VRHAINDPEIRQILRDPQVQMFLHEMKTNLKTANERLNKDVKMQEAVSKRMDAGVLRWATLRLDLKIRPFVPPLGC